MRPARSGKSPWIARCAVVALAVAGCSAQASRPPGNAFVGEVWTWDEQESTVTLRRDTEDIRVKVTPEQLRGLKLHQIATVHGELAPPMEVPRIITPAMPVRAVPRGPVDQQAVSGVVTAADPRGRLSIQSDRGPLHVWAASGADQRFPPGAKVRVDIAVQAVDMVPAPAGSPAAVPVAPPLPPATEPGDFAIVTGRIIGLDQSGVLVVESPTGPVQVWVPDSAKYRVEQPVQIRTHVATAP